MFIRHLDFNCASRYQRRQRQVKLEECVKVGYAHSPPRRGGEDAPSEAEAQTGWSDRLKRFAELTTPALRATPPLQRRGMRPSNSVDSIDGIYFGG